MYKKFIREKVIYNIMSFCLQKFKKTLEGLIHELHLGIFNTPLTFTV